MSPNKPTIKDVAERAGCGIATVSRVLNSSGPTSVASRKRVLAAADELGFKFNEFGRSLKSQRSKTIGVLVPTLSNPVFADAVQGIQQAAAIHGYDVILTCANYDQKTELTALATLVAKQVEGVVLTVSSPENSAALQMLDDNSIPYCLIFNQPKAANMSAVGVNNVEAARVVGQRLFELGHLDAAFVAVQFAQSDRSADRYKGFAEIYAKHGLNQPTLLEVDFAPGDLEIALVNLFEETPSTTALFASNDMLALACIRALRTLGMSVPEDVSVVGFDGIAVADLVHPKLATIATPCHDMGSKAAQLLVRALQKNEKPPTGVISLPFEFRCGESLTLAAKKKRRQSSCNLTAGFVSHQNATKHIK